MRFLALLPALFLVGCVAAPPGGVPGAALGAKVTVAATPGETGPEVATSEEAGPKEAGLKKANGAAEAKAAPATTTARNPGSASANAGENAGENPSKNTGANAGTNTGAQDALGVAAQRRLAARPPTPAPTPEPEALMGLDRAQISRLLGKPGLVRRDASAEVWQYVGAGCVLDLFLYGDSGDGGSGGRYRVTHYEMRGRDAGEIQPRRCLDGLVAARGPGKTG